MAWHDGELNLHFVCKLDGHTDALDDTLDGYLMTQL